ncbi:hypothetical protein RvY_09179 [Ramazzottius varieornatus]|uniref:Uncharacterized protein n=1 Tax=Ramazzottius varieornatus TaxID=947166 RepID=A0A1D1VAY2_RAMVA|nr:hypothetical protein RvY_09179 [Ramazzottius varieornatus]
MEAYRSLAFRRATVCGGFSRLLKRCFPPAPRLIKRRKQRLLHKYRGSDEAGLG